MSAEKILYQLKDAELRTGELYALIGLSLSVTQLRLSELFDELAEEEKLHARQIELMQTMIMQSREAFLQTPEAEDLISDFLGYLDMVRAQFNRHYDKLQPADLIAMALDIERHMVEAHGCFFVSVTDEATRRFFKNLNLGNEAHIRKLESFQPG